MLLHPSSALILEFRWLDLGFLVVKMRSPYIWKLDGGPTNHGHNFPNTLLVVNVPLISFSSCIKFPFNSEDHTANEKILIFSHLNELLLAINVRITQMFTLSITVSTGPMRHQQLDTLLGPHHPQSH